MRLNFLASSVKVSERQFPHIHQMLLDGAYILDMDTVPELFVTQTPLVNAMALGTNQPFIVINSGLVDLLDPEELRAVIGHELGHVLSGHAVYRTMLYNLILLAQRIAWMPIGYIGLRAIIWGLEEWYRKSELSCDRAGLLAGQDVEASRRVLMKLAGGSRLAEMNADAFHEQAREYDRILGGDYPRRDTDRNASLGEEVRSAAKAYQESWNRSEDPLIGMVRGAAGTMASAAGGLFDRFSNRGGGGSSNDDN
jgi:Zn-dependent protease with chaperone function